MEGDGGQKRPSILHSSNVGVCVVSNRGVVVNKKAAVLHFKQGRGRGVKWRVLVGNKTPPSRIRVPEGWCVEVLAV